MFEDDQSCIATSDSKKLSAHPKCVSIKCHRFWGLLEKTIIKIKYVESIADILTKLIECNQFFKLRCMLMGW